MPPKNSSNRRKSATTSTNPPPVSEAQKNVLTNMFKRIESLDQSLKQCSNCSEKIKSCLMKDHLSTKCTARNNKNKTAEEDDEIIVLDEIDVKTEPASSKEKTSPSSIQISVSILNQSVNQISKVESVEKVDEEEEKVRLENDSNLNDLPIGKKLRRTLSVEVDIATECSNESEKDNRLLNEFFETNPKIFEDELKQVEKKLVKDEQEMSSSQSQSQRRVSGSKDFYLQNFESAIKTVLDETTFSCLLDEFDYQTIKKFSLLSIPTKILYVRLFQRKFKWLNLDNISYEKISSDLSENLDELIKETFLIDENSIDSCEEIVHLLKLPQLKELAKTCHVLNLAQNSKTRADLLKTILQHFKTQKSIKTHFFHARQSQSSVVDLDPKSQYMIHCKKILGKCYKLEKQVRAVFVRVLMLFSLSSTHHADPSKTDSGQQNLLQILKVNIGQVKYMNYEIRLTRNIFQDRQSFLRYQEALELEAELLNYIDSKEFDEAFDAFHPKIPSLKEAVLNQEHIAHDSQLPVYLRGFTSGYIHAKLISIFAYEVLQRLRKYQDANDLFEFLIKQNVYLLTSRGKWYERMALNYEAHLKNPLMSFECLNAGLMDKLNVREAARLALFQRLTKMSQTKKYLKLKNFGERLANLVTSEKYEIAEAKTVEIEGTLLHAEFIPGRKNVFIQNYDSESGDDNNNELESNVETTAKKSDTLIKNRYNLSVEEVAMTHYIKTQGYTSSKHGETVTLRSIFGLLFWDIIFDDKIENVFVDRFQSSPLDLQTDLFYLNRKEAIDNRLDLIFNSPSEIICELVSETWSRFKSVECQLVSWSLFEELEEFLSLLRCFNSQQLGNLCKYMAVNLRYCRSGGPDLVVWSTSSNKVKFVEVKGPGDRLSFKQIVWLDFLRKNDIECEVCYVKGQSSKRLRE